MEVIERDCIRKNMPNLMKNTTCTPALLQRLQTLHVLSQSDIQMIDSKKYTGAFSQTVCLYNILQSRVRGYNALIAALHSSKQFKSLQILLHDDYKKESRNYLRICIQTGGYDEVMSILQPSSSNSLCDIICALIAQDQLLHHCVGNSREDHPVTINSKTKILEALLQAVSNDENFNVIDFLESKDSEGRTPLLQENVATELQKCLLNYGTTVSQKDPHGNTLLHITAAQLGVTVDEYHDLVHHAISKDPSLVNCQNDKGETPLHVALKHLDLLNKTFNIFDKHIANFNLLDDHGNGTIHVLAGEKSMSGEKSKNLMENVALSSFRILSTPNHAGKSPIEITKETGNYKMFAVIARIYADTCGGKYDEVVRICDTEIDSLSDASSLEATWLLIAKAHIYLKFPNCPDLWATSLSIFQTCYEIRRNKLGEKHPDTLEAASDVALSLLKSGNFNEASEKFQKVYQKQKSFLGEDHLDTLASKCGVAITLGKLGQYVQAEQLLQEVFAKKCELLGENHLVSLATQHDVLNLLIHSGKYNEEILQSLQAILTRRTELLGETHDCIFLTQLDILECYKGLGKWIEAVALVEDMRKTVGNERVTQYVTNVQLNIIWARSYFQKFVGLFVRLFGVQI